MLVIEVTLRHGRYDAGLGGSGRVEYEWPPHPARVFMALLASAEDDDDREALEFLERCPPPEIYACHEEHIRAAVERRYVVTNAVAKKAGNLAHPARTNGVRVRAGALLLTEPTFAFVWPDSDVPERVLHRLRRMAAATPYLGRVTSEARLRVHATLHPRPHWKRYVPAGLTDRGTLVRVPYPGFTAALRAAYERGERAHLSARDIVYQLEEPEAEEATSVSPSPFGELLIFGFETPMAPIDGRWTCRVTTMLRKAVHERIGTMLGAPPKAPEEVLPPTISGRGADGRPHVAFLALPDVGHGHADGHIMGVALALPRDIPSEDRRVVLRALVTDPISHLTISRDVRAGLRFIDQQMLAARPSRTALTSQRWSGTDRGARRWSTATPLALDHFSRNPADDGRLVAEAVVRSGYPAPVDVCTQRSPILQGGVHRPTLAMLEPRRRRPLLHATITFPEPVQGPVIIGSLRYLGLGLCVPHPEYDDATTATTTTVSEP